MMDKTNSVVQIFQVTGETVNNEFTEKLKLSFPPDKDTQDWNTEKIREFIALSTNIFIVAMINREVVGFVFGWEIPRMENSKHFYIDEVATVEKYQRLVIAKDMLLYFQNILRAKDFELMYVLTKALNMPANRPYDHQDSNVEIEKDVVMYTYKFDKEK